MHGPKNARLNETKDIPSCWNKLIFHVVPSQRSVYGLTVHLWYQYSRTLPYDHLVQEGNPLLRAVLPALLFNMIKCLIKTTSLKCSHDCGFYCTVHFLWAYVYKRRRVSSVVEHSSSNPKVPGLILGPVLYRGHGL